MAQGTTIEPAPEIENTAATTTTECRHHWVIQPADGPVSNGSCRICGETREFKNYVESATWGDSRITNKNSSGSAGVESTSDDEDFGSRNLDDESRTPNEETDSEG